MKIGATTIANAQKSESVPSAAGHHGDFFLQTNLTCTVCKSGKSPQIAHFSSFFHFI
ncbi:MAG: hypothetical protein RBS77_04375 [Candidatus Moranbacteria bacterium]|jgi:hypothetical protein|nr:hypothetical protein [Candidatus Moranbacteria bacterium]